jgi:hypothetical protein
MPAEYSGHLFYRDASSKMILSLRMEFNDQNEPQPENGVAIYSKLAVLLFSIFLGPLIGGILLMLNLRSVGCKREGTQVLVFSIIYYFASSILIAYIINALGIALDNKAALQNPKIIVSLLILNIIGGGILAEYFFKKYFPHNDYEHKSIWKPLIVTLLILIPIRMLVGL